MSWAFIDAILPPRCLACATIVAGASPWCVPCHEGLARASEHGAFVYVGPLQDAIRRAKIGHDAAVARGLARFLASADVDVPGADAVTFVPAPWRRRLARGFDLPALLAAALATKERPLVDLLVATRHDPRLAVSGSREERLRLVQGRYARRRTRAYERFAGRRILVVDDVRTTGATLAAACAAIEDGGLRAVPWALAVTP